MICNSVCIKSYLTTSHACIILWCYKSRMTTYAEMHHYIIFIDYSVYFFNLIVNKMILQLQCKIKRIFLFSIFIGFKSHNQHTVSMLNKCELHISCKSVLTHFIYFSIINALVILIFANKREKNRCNSFPSFGISIPHSVCIVSFTYYISYFTPLRIHRNF